jgi:hypothetical protein
VKPNQERSRSAHDIDAFVQDLRQGIRGLAKAPAFATVAITALALGIGASMAIFSVVNAVLLRPLPYPDPDRIAVFATASPTARIVASASPLEFNFWRGQAVTFEDISAYRFSWISMTGVDHTEQIRAALVTSSYFRLFGEKVAAGRTFMAEEDRPAGKNVVVLSAEFWRQALGGDARMIGKEIILGGKPRRVVGIMAQSVELPPIFSPAEAREPIDVWLPFQIDPRSTETNKYFSVAARLSPGIHLGGMRAHLQVATQHFKERFPAAGMAPQAVFTAVGIKDASISRAVLEDLRSWLDEHEPLDDDYGPRPAESCGFRSTNIRVEPAQIEEAFGYRGGRRYITLHWSPKANQVFVCDGIGRWFSGAVDTWNQFLNHPLVKPHLQGWDESEKP